MTFHFLKIIFNKKEFMKRIFTINTLVILFFSCKNSVNENKPLTATDFLKLYSTLSLPANVSDSGLVSFGDTATINTSVFTTFISDSAVQNVLPGNVSKYIIHPAGIIHFKTADYLLTKFTAGKTVKLVVFVLDDKHHYKNSLLLLDNQNSDGYHYSVSITNEPTFIIKKEKTDSDNKILYSRHGYAFNESANNFTEVMNDTNEEKADNIINPIDTLAQLNKFSADYITDKKNFISVRDGKNSHTYIFFIHFEKNKAACVGELKGEMSLVNETNAVYQESGDPCVINFKFTAASIKVKEEGNCGNYRGINCLFDFTFKKKKLNKTKGG
jgi:hypothetical protein